MDAAGVEKASTSPPAGRSRLLFLDDPFGHRHAGGVTIAVGPVAVDFDHNRLRRLPGVGMEAVSVGHEDHLHQRGLSDALRPANRRIETPVWWASALSAVVGCSSVLSIAAV